MSTTRCNFRSMTRVAVLLSMAVLISLPAAAEDLKVLKMGLGSGTVTLTPTGTSCGTGCQRYATGTPVTLTITEDPDSDFAGWDVDPDADPSTTPDCAGISLTCNLVMDEDRSVRPTFDFDPTVVPIPTMNRSPDPASPGDFLAYSPTEIETHLASFTEINTAARFLEALPDEFKQNWILMTRSESLQTGTAEFPRILLPSQDAKSTFTLGLVGHSGYPGSHPDAIEYMQWDATEKNFRFHEIVVADIPAMDFDGDGVGVIPMRPRGITADEPRCFLCHSTRNVRNPGTTAGTTGTRPGVVKFKNKPNWDAYDSWGGMSPFNRDRIYQNSLEAAVFRKIFNPWTWETNDFVRSIVGQMKLQPALVPAASAITRKQGGADDGEINFAFDSPPPPANSETTDTITTNYSFDGAAGTGTPSTVSRGGMFVRLQNSDSPGDIEGRGVDFFDLLGGLDGDLNAQRIADEIIDHRFATGSIPIDVRPIAMAIAKGSCLSINSATNTVEGTSPLTIPLTFFDTRHGMGINELLADTKARSESLPLRKADIQKINLDRAGDIYLSDSPPVGENQNGLIPQYGDGTAAGTSTAPSRIRQEVFRRRTVPGSAVSGLTAPDRTVMGGIFVDRERYGSSSDPTSPLYSNLNTTDIALYRYFLEPLGVSVDKWSMGVRGRSRTYTFADVFGVYTNRFQAELRTSLLTDRTPPGMTDADDCGQLIDAVNLTLSTTVLPPASGPGSAPTYTDVQRIFNKSCVECHGGLDYPPYGRYGDSLDLSEEENPTPPADRLERAEAIARLRIAATAASSQLYLRVTGALSMIDPADPTKTVPYDPATIDESCPNFTGLMPCGGPPLSQADILTIRRWIEGGTAGSRGDPHIKTLDGTHYDFQAAGEFVLLRGQNFEVQARHAAVESRSPLGPNPYTGLTSCVSVNSAVAVRIGPHRVTYQPNLSGEPDPDGLQLRIDGELTEMDGDEIPLASGGRILRINTSGGLQIETPGGAAVVVTPSWWSHQQLWYMNIDVRNARATRGLMGTIAPGNWLPARPDGTFLGPRPEKLPDRYAQLYGDFGYAWQVNDETTLFDYAPGTSTVDFTVEGWPRGESPQSCELPPREMEERPEPQPTLKDEVAAQHCDGIVDENTKFNCVQDVMVTGETGFAQLYLLAEAIELNAMPEAPVQVEPADNQTGVTQPVRLVWNETTDADGDPITYRLCVWAAGEVPDINRCEPLPPRTTLSGEGLRCAVLVLLVGLLLLVVLYYLGLRRKTALLVVIAILILLVALFALRLCGGGPVNKSVSGLEPGKDYYWKVIAEDGKGGSVHSPTRHFQVE